MQGIDCPVTKETAIYLDTGYCNGNWFAPCLLVHPSEQDLKAQKKIDIQKLAEEKALDAGLTPEDIINLQG